MIPPVPIHTESARRGNGCGGAVAVALNTLGTLIVIGIAQTASWTLDEAHFLGYFRAPGPQRVLALLIPLVVMIPLLRFSASRGRDPALRSVYQTWSLALAFSAVMSLARLPGLTQPFQAHLMQLLLELAFLLFLLRGPRAPEAGPRAWSGLPPAALLAAGLMALPWIVVGALGGALDSLVTLGIGLLFGADAALVLEGSLFLAAGRDAANPGRGSGFIGLAAVITLLGMVVGLQINGLQSYLMLPLPILGLLAYGLFLGRTDPDSRIQAPGPDARRGWTASAAVIGISAASALLFVDPKELSVVVGSGTGETLQWITRAGLVSLVIGFLSGLAGILAHRNIPRWGKGPLLKGAAAAVWIGAALFFGLAGRAGFFGDRLFVVLKDQADVSAASSMQNYDQRRVFVYQTLVDKAKTTQAPLRETLSRFGIRYTPYYLVNGMEVQAGPLLGAWLKTRPEVDRVLVDSILRPLPENIPADRGTAPAPSGVQWNVALIGADRVWNELHVYGKGVVVGQSDTGVQGDHPDLADAYRGKTSGDAYNWLDPWNHTPHPVDANGHGTHTLGIVLGKYTGIAPQATWFACVNEARNMGNPADYLNCMQYMLAPYPQGRDPFKDGDPTRSANVMNNSWGCPDLEGCDPGALRAAVNALRAAGIFVVASAGNAGMGGCGTVTDPLAIYPGVFSVGSIDQQGKLSVFSSLGPVTVDGSGRTKPDILAPGEHVLSAFPGSTYQYEDGTSMAGPHVVGVVALMWSANPKLVGNIERTDQILEQTAQAYQGSIPACGSTNQRPNDAAGWGIVDAYAAVKASLAVK